jgi:hypothetical protein
MGRGIIVTTAFLYLMAFCAQTVLPMGMYTVEASQMQDMGGQCDTHHPGASPANDGMAKNQSLCCPMACCGNIMDARLDWSRDVVVLHDVPANRAFIPLLQVKGLFHPPKAIA